MDKFRSVLKRRLALAGVYSAAVLLLIGIGAAAGRAYAVADFIVGFNSGLCIGIQAVMIYHMARYQAALKDPEKLKSLYIEEHDERNRFIEAQIGGAGINVILGGLALGTVVSGFLNETVFFALLGALLFSVSVKGALKLYFYKKV